MEQGTERAKVRADEMRVTLASTLGDTAGRKVVLTLTSLLCHRSLWTDQLHAHANKNTVNLAQTYRRSTGECSEFVTYSTNSHISKHKPSDAGKHLQ